MPIHLALMKRKNLIKYDYFDNIDTEYKAYILGFIYADGTIDDKVKGLREWRLRISIQQEDGYILKKLLEETNKKDIIIRNPISTIKNDWKIQSSATINNTYLCKKLIELGCYPRKSTEGMKFPELKENFISHFIRGFFDGDGCITIKKKIYKGKTKSSTYYRKTIAFTSTDKEFLDTLISYLPIQKIYKTSKLRGMIVYTYWVERKKDIEEIKNYFYTNSNFYLQRKFNKFNMSIKSQALDTSKEGLTTT